MRGMYKIIFLLLLIPLTGFSQSLNFQETIDYLNKLSADHPGETSDIDNKFTDDNCKNKIEFKISYDKNSRRIEIQDYIEYFDCNTSSNNITARRYSYRFYTSEIDPDSITYDVDDYNNRVGIIADYGVIDRYPYLPSQKRYYENGTTVKYISIYLNDRGYLKVYYHGLKYLLQLEKENIENEVNDKKDDPFDAITNDEAKVSKIPLVEKNGVSTLIIDFGSGNSSSFVLDSGAGECNISPELEKKLILHGIIKKSDYLPNGLYKLADGSVVENRRVKIHRLKIGSKTVSNVIASIGPQKSPNLLGQSFLNQLNKWSIDNAEKLLIIQ